MSLKRRKGNKTVTEKFIGFCFFFFFLGVYLFSHVRNALEWLFYCKKKVVYFKQFSFKQGK